jgi:hypothetical protein
MPKVALTDLLEGTSGVNPTLAAVYGFLIELSSINRCTPQFPPPRLSRHASPL